MMKKMKEMLLLIMLIIPTVAIADADYTHAVSGELTISNYNPDEIYQVQWRTAHPYNPGSYLTLKSYTVPADGDGIYPFELQCDSNTNSSCATVVGWIVRTRYNNVTMTSSKSDPIVLDFSE